MTAAPLPGEEDPVHPLAVRLRGRRVAVVGGGRRAHRDVVGLVRAGARVTLISPALTPALDALAAAGRVDWQRRGYRAGDLRGVWYAVAATDDPAVNQAVAHEAEQDHVFCDVPDAVGRGGSTGAAVGRVVLVGGGPGDPDLITLRGQRALAEADVVVVDHLAPQSLLAALARDVEVVDAAKLPRGRAMPQEEINALLISRALAGKRVVRLKGGDPFVFGRGMEEVEACTTAGIPVEVVPGVTSAIGVPGLAGIPVTHRGLTHEFVVVSGHLPPGHPQSLVDWPALGRLRGTLVVLMGVHTAAAISAALIEHGRSPDTPVAVVAEGATPHQRLVRTTLERLPRTVQAEAVRPPAVWVAGDVVGLQAAEWQRAAAR